MFLFLDLERDLHNLDKPPKIAQSGTDGAVFMKWRPRLHYLLRSAWATKKKGGNRRRVCTLFAKSERSFNREVKRDIEKLEDFVKPVARHIGVANLLDTKIEVVDVKSDHKRIYRKIQRITTDEPVKEIPLSWVFLRSSFFLSHRVLVSKNKLRKKATECGIDETSLFKFCKFYTSFGSIIDLSLIDPQCELVLVKPIQFLKKLGEFIYPKDDTLEHNPIIKFGIVPEDFCISAFDSFNWSTVMAALEFLNLATKITHGSLELLQYSLDYNKMYYYIPLCCKGDPITEVDPNSVYLITSIDTPHFFKQVAIVKYLLTSLRALQPKLLPCTNINQTVIKATATDTVVTFTFHSPVVGIHLDKLDSLVLSYVVQSFNDIAKNAFESSDIKVKYKFVRMCAEKEIFNIDSLLSSCYHILPYDGRCEDCTVTGRNDELLKVWNEVLRKNKVPEELRPKKIIKSYEIAQIAKKISVYCNASSIDLHHIAESFIPDYKSFPQFQHLTGERLLNEILDFWQHEISDKGNIGLETRRVLAKRLSKLGKTLFQHSREFENKFEKLAKKIDVYWRSPLFKVLPIKEVTDSSINTVLPAAHDPKTEQNNVQLKKTEELLKELNELKEFSKKNEEQTKLQFEEKEKKLELQFEEKVKQLKLQFEEKVKQLKLQFEERESQLKENQKHKESITRQLIQIRKISLYQSDIPKLFVILQSIEDKWYSLGQSLGVSRTVLDDINEKREKPLQCLLEVWCEEGEATLSQLENGLKMIEKNELLPTLGSLKIIEQDIHLNPLMDIKDKLNCLRDAVIAGQKSFDIHGESQQTISWEKYGLRRIEVASGSLSQPETAEATVAALVGGQFVFPENTTLVSAVYIISLSKPLLQPLKLEIQHCVNITREDQIKYLKFAIAPVNSFHLPFQFEIIEEGEFTVESSYGSILNKNFCLISIVGQIEDILKPPMNSADEELDDQSEHEVLSQSTEELTDFDEDIHEQNLYLSIENDEVNDNLSVQNKESVISNASAKTFTKSPTTLTEGSTHSLSSQSTGIVEAMMYAGLVYYKQDGVEDIVTITAAKNLNTLIQYVKQENSNEKVKIGQDFYFTFKEMHGFIELKFDTPQDDLYTGWIIKTHLKPPRLYQDVIDKFGTTDFPAPTKCLISVYGSPDAVPMLHYGIPLEGVVEPVEVFVHIRRRTTGANSSSTNESHASVIVSEEGPIADNPPAVNASDVFKRKFPDLSQGLSSANFLSVTEVFFSKNLITFDVFTSVTECSNFTHQNANKVTRELYNRIQASPNPRKLLSIICDVLIEKGDNHLKEIGHSMKTIET